MFWQVASKLDNDKKEEGLIRSVKPIRKQ